MAALNVNIPDKLKSNLITLAKELHQSEEAIIINLLENYSLDLKEDIEDYNRAIKVLEKNNKSIPWEQVQRELGLLEN